MAKSVIGPHQVVLNDIHFPIMGDVRETSVGQFPAKITVGEPEYATELILSNWVINDQRGGMLVEEMDESVHADRYYWSTCDNRFRSNIMLLPLATLLTAPAVTTGWLTPNGYEDPDAGWDSEANAYDDSTTTAANSANLAMNTWTSGLIIKSTNAAYCDSVRVYVTGQPASEQINLDAWYDGQWNDVYQGSIATGEWVTKTLSATKWVYKIRIALRETDSAGYRIHYVYEVDFNRADASSALGTSSHFCEFNSKTYVSFGNVLGELNAGNTGFDYVNAFGATITQLLVSNDGNLVVFLGDSDNYFYMSTVEVFTETNVALANLGIRHDGKTWKMAVNGRWWYSTAPSSATPTWTAADASGGIDDYALTPKSLEVYQDADGNLIPYCATARGLYAYDDVGAMWIETALALPDHARTGLGLVVWHDALFVSGGLSVTKYAVGGTAVISEIGLQQDDGLPALRSGEIVKFIKGYNEFFALIDSTYEGATSLSQVVSYDGKGWRTWWVNATADVNKNMYAGIVTSVNKHQLFFSTTDGVYSIPLQRTSINPKKVASYAYAASAIHISPRFDAGTKVFPKLATKLTLFLDDMATNETITVYYQINQSQATIADGSGAFVGWTALLASKGSGGTDLLGAMTADGVEEAYFDSDGTGVLFYDIQFKLRFLRRTTGDNPEYYSPIVKGMVLSYIKRPGRKKAWFFTINVAEAGKVGSTEKTLRDAIQTILSTNTLMNFTFRDGSDSADTHYVIVDPYSSTMPTGQDWRGMYNVTVVEV